MKKLGLILVFALCTAFAAQAQDKERTDSYPYWAISKGVQAQQYKNVKLLPAKISTGDLAWFVSKGVQQRNAESRQSTGRVAMNGYPSWIVSKGVARAQYEKSNSSN